jgi:hypothetical protein
MTAMTTIPTITTDAQAFTRAEPHPSRACLHDVWVIAARA